MPFADLPPEVVEILAECLAYEHPPTLLNLARANKSLHAWCASALKMVFFHDIKLSVAPERDIAKLVESLQRKIEAANSFGQVRRLIITTTRDESIPSEEWKPPTFFALRRTGLIDRFSTQYSYVRGHTAYWIPKSALDIPDYAWKPVAGLIRRLPALTDVIYRYSDGLPLILLEALRSTCRLHMHIFLGREMIFSGLVSRGPAWITSPSLSCVTIHLNSSNSIDRDLERFQAVCRALSLAPKLKQVMVSNCVYGDRWAPLQAQDCTSEAGGRLISPEAFFLGDYNQTCLIDDTTLDKLRHCVDLSQVERLELKPGLSEAGFETLKEYARLSRGFSRLRSLKLDIYPCFPNRHSATFYDSVTEFVGRLPPLSELELQGWHSHISIESIARTHGCRLRKLHFNGHSIRWQHANEKDILQLGKYCPLLEELTITVQRSKGDKKEVALYRALGTLPSLLYLNLSLEVSPAALYQEAECFAVPIRYSFGTRKSPPDPSFDDFDNQFSDLYSDGFYMVRKGYIRDVMINSRVDQELARSIFRVISSSKCQGVQPLEAIQIFVTGDGGSGSGLVRLVDLFSSTWIIRRDTRENHRDELRVEEQPLLYFERNVLRSRETYLGSELDEIFRRIWPTKEDQKQRGSFTKKLAAWRRKTKMQDKGKKISSFWWNDCHSFPLDMSS